MSHDEGGRCLCISEHDPEPMELNWHHVLPLAMGGPDTPAGVLGENGVWLCPTAHANVHELLRTFLREGPLSYWECIERWEPRVNRYCYDIALEGLIRFLRQIVTLTGTGGG